MPILLQVSRTILPNLFVEIILTKACDKTMKVKLNLSQISGANLKRSGSFGNLNLRASVKLYSYNMSRPDTWSAQT